MTAEHRDPRRSSETGAVNAIPSSGPAAGSELLIFRAGDERFAIAVSPLEAVIQMPKLQPLPGMPTGMIGVAELRGSLVPVYSPARVLNVDVGNPTAAIVVRLGRDGTAGAGRRAAIAVTAAEGVMVYEPGAWSGIGGPTPSAGLVRGVTSIEGQLTTLVDTMAFVGACMDASRNEES